MAHVPQAVLDDLNTRIRYTRWPTTAAEAGWATGTNLATLQALAAYWVTDFDWRRVETRLNAYSNFTTKINGQRIHFLHIRSPAPRPIPLLLTHGWPGSCLKLLPLIPLLTADGPVFGEDFY